MLDKKCLTFKINRGTIEKMMLMENERYLIKNLNKKNVGIWIYPLIVIACLTFVMGFYYGNNAVVNFEDITVELGDKLPEETLKYTEALFNNSELMIEDNVPKDNEGHTLIAGVYSYYLVYVDDIYKFSKYTNKKANITVVDTTKPKMIVKESEFDFGTDLVPEDIVTCEDYSLCKMSFKEEIDTEKSGDYEVTILAKDSAQNTNEQTIKITIKEKPIPVVANYSYSFSTMEQNNNLVNSKLSEDEKNNLRHQLINFAMQFVGNPYVYGGASLTNGTDCSGFTMSVYGNYGYQLPRVAISQAYIGKRVSYDELMPGDIIVYHYANGGGHAGIYIGNGMMVHAGTQATGITISYMFDGYRTYQRIIY